jgi:hypothetical protein
MSNNRYLSIISRNADEGIDEDHWLKQFQKKLIEKEAVQPKSTDSFLFDQINSIMNNKSKYPSVAAAVEDMKDRSGLSAFLNNVKISEDDQSGQQSKKASDNNSAIAKQVPVEQKLPALLLKAPHIKRTIENIIKSTKGNLSLPAIIGRTRDIHQNDVSEAKDWECDDLVKYVSRLNLDEKSKAPQQNESMNLGTRDDAANDDIDSANTDFFSGLVPAKTT